MSDKQISKIYITIIGGLLSVVATSIIAVIANMQFTRDTVRDVKILQEIQINEVSELKQNKLNKEAFEYYKVDLNNQLRSINQSLDEIKKKLQ